MVPIEDEAQFYLGAVSNDEARRCVRSKRKGTFCVRRSGKLNQYIINTNNKV